MIKRIGLLIALSIISISSLAVRLQADVDKSAITASDTFNLIITIDQQTATSPDISVLQENFQILGTSQSSQVDLSNNQMQAETRWMIELQAKHTGNITIPAIRVGKQYTTPIKIKVSDSPAVSNISTTKDIFLETSIQPQHPLVQSQVVYKVKVFVSESIAHRSDSATLVPPSATDTIVKQIGKFNYYGVRRGGRPYQVAEAQFALFPQRSGSLEINPAHFQGSVFVKLQNNQFNDPFFNNNFFSTGLRPIDLTASKVTLDVQAQPADYPTDASWLPAQNIQLKEAWSDDIQKMRVGEPITRTITLETVGLTAEQLPIFKFDSLENINVYPDSPLYKTFSSGNNIAGKLTQKIVYVPIKQGPFTLPALSISWWNVNAQKIEKITLPEQPITILASLHPENSLNDLPPTIKKLVTNPVIKQAKANDSLPYLPWLIASFAFLVLAILLLLKRPIPTTTITKPFISKKARLKQIRRKIKKFCKQNDFENTKVYLLKWANTKNSEKPTRSIGQLSDNISDIELQEAIKRLDYVLYADGKSTWDGKAFWRIFKKSQMKKTAQVKSEKDPLPSMYPKL